MSLERPWRIRMRVLDGKPRAYNTLKALVPHVYVRDVAEGMEFVICAEKKAHLDQVRKRFSAAGLEELPGGDTDVSLPPVPPGPAKIQGRQGMAPGQRSGASRGTAQPSTPKLKPYGFVQLPDELMTAPPVWHDGTGTKGRLSGEIRCEIETLTPLLVGWERRTIGDIKPIPKSWSAWVGGTQGTKPVLCPLRAPWGDRPVLLPGDSIKGLLRHELGALFGAPMERVAERSYSYRPNSLFPNEPNPRLVARLARIADDGVEMRPLDPNGAHSPPVRVPVRLDLLPKNLKYDKNKNSDPPRYRFDANGGAAYRGGQGAGEKLNSKRNLHKTLEANPHSPTTSAPVPETVQLGYLNTLRHLVDPQHGHFSERHPDVPNNVRGEDARQRILEAASKIVFSPGDIIWVEWDETKSCIVSLGWHYYYRWAYTDTVRRTGWTLERRGLFPLDAEKAVDDQGVPQGLSAIRRLFGYTGSWPGMSRSGPSLAPLPNEGSKGIGGGDHEQLMGRLSVNAAIEVINPDDTDQERFLPPTFLKELGMPRPSAVEHYLDQPHHPNQRPSDRASLVTYGDAAGYDEPGTLAGRKFYFDRKDAYTGEPWSDESKANRGNDRSTLALEASCPGRRFRFTVRFRDLDAGELAAILAALCPHQFRDVLDGGHAEGYCSKLGYARPLGWGSVRIEAKALLLLDSSGDKPALTPTTDLSQWLRERIAPMPMLQQWLAVHRHKHPDAADYPRGQDGDIYSYHTALRAGHSRARRYDRGYNR